MSQDSCSEPKPQDMLYSDHRVRYLEISHTCAIFLLFFLITCIGYFSVSVANAQENIEQRRMKGLFYLC